jgi:hypothetical protein
MSFFRVLEIKSGSLSDESRPVTLHMTNLCSGRKGTGRRCSKGKDVIRVLVTLQ